MTKKLTTKQKAYDAFVSPCGSDVCFDYGMAGKCGPECPDFGLRDGCRDLVEEEDDD